MKISVYTFNLSVLFVTLLSCSNNNNNQLPYIGNHDIIDGDTLYHKIPPFQFISHDSVTVDNGYLADHIYVSDFFFISCPAICPKVKKQMLRIYEEFEEEELLKLVSHTLDTKRDSIPELKNYATNLGVEHDRWMFLTGDRDEVWQMSSEYFIATAENDEAARGIDHSGRIVLVDKKGHVRSFAEGTDPEHVSRLIDDIHLLIGQYKR
ncbi:MAG: SCO family protein [Bacteroidota bacterium]